MRWLRENARVAKSIGIFCKVKKGYNPPVDVDDDLFYFDERMIFFFSNNRNPNKRTNDNDDDDNVYLKGSSIRT